MVVGACEVQSLTYCGVGHACLAHPKRARAHTFCTWTSSLTVDYQIPDTSRIAFLDRQTQSSQDVPIVEGMNSNW
jgi:hypothetical protein